MSLSRTTDQIRKTMVLADVPLPANMMARSSSATSTSVNLRRNHVSGFSVRLVITAARLSFPRSRRTISTQNYTLIVRTLCSIYRRLYCIIAHLDPIVQESERFSDGCPGKKSSNGPYWWQQCRLDEVSLCDVTRSVFAPMRMLLEMLRAPG